jgi:hypothetical protein
MKNYSILNYHDLQYCRYFNYVDRIQYIVLLCATVMERFSRLMT